MGIATIRYHKPPRDVVSFVSSHPASHWEESEWLDAGDSR
jgi:hypothetical protein